MARKRVNTLGESVRMFVHIDENGVRTEKAESEFTKEELDIIYGNIIDTYMHTLGFEKVIES